MNIIKESDAVLGVFGDDYAKCNAMRIKLVDDSVILVCGLRTSFNTFFDVYYAAIPVFSYFDTRRTFLNNAIAFDARFELGCKTPQFFLINPGPDETDAIVNAVSACAKWAFDQLEGIASLDDCLAFYEEKRKKGFPLNLAMREHIDMLLFRREFDGLKALLENDLFIGIKRIFGEHNVEFPKDGNWQRFLPPDEHTENKFAHELFWARNKSYWSKIRLPLAQGEYYKLCEELALDYQKNKKRLKKLGMPVGEKMDIMMEELMASIENKQ